MSSIAKTYVSAADVVEEARKMAERVRYEFEKPMLSKEEKHVEDQVFSSLSVVYYDNGSKRYKHTVGVGLIETPDSMPFMEYVQKILDKVNESILLGAGNIWQHSVAQWRISWDPKED